MSTHAQKSPNAVEFSKQEMSAHTQRRLMQLQSTVQALQCCNDHQFREYEQFFTSAKLGAFFADKMMGEQFQIELEQWNIYGVVDSSQPQPYREIASIFLIPSVYPACSPSKKHLVPKIVQELLDNIPWQWRVSDATNHPSYP